MSKYTLRDTIQNKDTRTDLGVANIEIKNEGKSFKMVWTWAKTKY